MGARVVTPLLQRPTRSLTQPVDSPPGIGPAPDLDRSISAGQIRGLVVVLTVLGAFRLLFPGDAPFVNDEARLIQHALEANASGRPAAAGLSGTFGTRYGPAPTWFYQLSLAFTSDPTLIVFARTLLVTTLTGLALVLLARTLPGVSPPFAAFAFLSPYLWLYARDLWDNSFSVPFVAMALASYAQFCRASALRYLAVSAIFATLAFLTHLMTLPLILAIGLHFVIARWRELLASPRLALATGAIVAICLSLSLPYLGELSAGAPRGFDLVPRPVSLAFALDGIRIFTLLGFDYFIGPWLPSGLGVAARAVSALSYAVGLFGLMLCVRAVRPVGGGGGENAGPGGGARQHVGEGERPGAGEGDLVGRQIAAVLLMALVLFVLLVNGLGLGVHPHYYSGVWIVFFCFWWMGMSRLGRMAWARRAFLVQAFVMGAFVVGVASWIHVNGGTRTIHYGPALEEQMAVARELERRGAGDAPPSIPLGPRLFPHGISVLRTLDRRSRGVDTPAFADPSSELGVLIVYADPDGSSAELAVEELP